MFVRRFPSRRRWLTRSQQDWTRYSSWAHGLTMRAVIRSSGPFLEFRSKLRPNWFSFSSEQLCSQTLSSQSKKAVCCFQTQRRQGTWRRSHLAGARQRKARIETVRAARSSQGWRASEADKCPSASASNFRACCMSVALIDIGLPCAVTSSSTEMAWRSVDCAAFQS